MSYSFDIIGIATAWNFFKHQQRVEQSPDRGCAYVGSYECTLDSLISATDRVHQKPSWDWDLVAAKIVDFWIKDSDRVSQWKQELARAEETSLIVGRVANFSNLRSEFETLLQQ